MPTDILPSIIIIAVLLVFSAFFSASETAFSTCNRIKLKTLAEKGHKGAKRALKIADAFDKTLTTILIGNNIVNIASTSIATTLFVTLFGDAGAGIATAVMTVLVLIFGEILPKSLAKETADDGVVWMSVPLKFIMFILTPFSALFTLLKNGIIKLFNVRSSNTGVTADELLYIVNEGEEQGSLDEDESDLVRSAILFDGKNAEDILVPRVSLVAVEINQSVEEIKKVFVEEMYSRLPVYEKTIDSIVGIITFKSFMRLMEQGGTSIQSIIQKPLYVSTLKPINDIMQEMQKSKQHIAVVVDQFGGTEGIVTMEDIIEELVGEIYDESDEVLQPVIALGDDIYLISGELSVNDMLEKLGLPENTITSEYTTVAGWALELFEGIPSENQTIDIEKFTVTAVKLDEQRVEKVKVVVKN